MLQTKLCTWLVKVLFPSNYETGLHRGADTATLAKRHHTCALHIYTVLLYFTMHGMFVRSWKVTFLENEVFFGKLWILVLTKPLRFFGHLKFCVSQ